MRLHYVSLFLGFVSTSCLLDVEGIDNNEDLVISTETATDSSDNTRSPDKPDTPYTATSTGENGCGANHWKTIIINGKVVQMEVPFGCDGYEHYTGMPLP